MITTENLNNRDEFLSLSAEVIKAAVLQNTSYLLQSPYLNLQAAGSQGKDSAKGIHLRWFLDGYLGDNHIPKGNYSQNNNFFNKKDDYIKLYRIPYNIKDQINRTFNLSGKKPNFIHNELRLWIYKNNNNTFYLRFLDITKYQEVLTAINPENDHLKFLSEYGRSVFELELKNHLSFAINLSAKQNSKVRLESFSVQNKSVAEDKKIISARRTFTYQDSSQSRIVAENIKSIRFTVESGSLQSIGFETYNDFFIFSQRAKLIQDIGNFALTEDRDIAFERLEDTPGFSIDNSWLKFNEDAFVNVKNYHHRWEVNGGLQDGIEEYIQLSETDPSATQTYNDELDLVNTTTMDVSLQNFLNIASTDFHIARILGMGHIDVKAIEPKQEYIYLAQYRTEKDPENYIVRKNINHFYLSLPTSILEERLPQDVNLNPIAYGLRIDNGTDNPLLITDNQGYAPYTPIRYINLKTILKFDFRKSLSFFNPELEFESSEFSIPVFVGFENRKENETNWIKPEISFDSDYKDSKGIFETKPIFFNENDKPTFIHEVTKEGVDEYAAYPINIFSRASSLSNIRKTNYTKFRKANTLKAPTNIAVQLIQAENPLLLTSQTEQGWLQAIDTTKTEILCRLTFDYYHIHDLNYRYGNKIRIFHKKQFPQKIIGALNSLSNNDSQNPFCVLNTADHNYSSSGETFIPKIDPGIKSKFIGGVLTYRSKNYFIEDIILPNSSGLYPKIKIRKIENRISTLIPGTQAYQLKQVFEAPIIDGTEGFLIVENLSKAANWTETTTNRLNFEVELGLAGWLQNTENYTDSEGNVKREKVKGIWDEANITALKSPSLLDPSQLIENGRYEINLNTTILTNHPQYLSPDNPLNKPSVNWYRGYIRIHTTADIANDLQRKELKIEQILEINTGNNLKLIAIDPNFSTADQSKNIKTGTDISVNYHPGYRVYLRKEDAISFNRASILPLEDEGTKSSLIGLQTIDTLSLDTDGNIYGSPVSAPAMLLARELRPPKRPRLPIGPTYATPPDFYNKSNYSFITEFDQKPWGLIFCRIDSNKILSSLYKKDTIDEILQSLPPVNDDPFLGNRWLNLLSFDYSSNSGDFEIIPTDSQGNSFKFPKPDRTDIFTSTFNNPEDVIETIKDAIFSNLLPLTEQPLIFKYIKGGNYVPKSKKQKVTDANGKVLIPSHPDFDQAPMAKKINNTKILFTDFTLDGNMSSEALCFYVVREMSNSMQFGEPSPFMGPVKLVNTKAPERLIISKLNTQIASVNNNFESAVIFEINKFQKSQEISKIQILRTQNSLDALSIRNMNVVKEIEVQDLDLSNESITIKDDFLNDAELPFGALLYYKLVGIKQINYVDVSNSPKSISVFSEPTKTLLANIIDAQNPETPHLAVDSKTEVDSVIEQIKFSWDKTCFNGKYQLFILRNDVWQKIFKVESNDPIALNFTYPCNLNVENTLGEKIYYKFKVDVENTSGLINKESEILAI